MLIETVTNLTVRLPNGLLQRLCPGEAVDLPETVALRLLERAGGKVRVIRLPAQGDLLTWKSPLFGLCHGRVLEILDGQYFLVAHPRLEAPTAILRDWLRV